MDQELNGARVPFDMRLHLPPMAQTSFIADNYHAMKRLVAEGYITIKPNAKLRLGPSGLWQADGQSPLVETTSREESPVEPYISAETVNNRTSLGPNFSHGGWNSNSVGKEEAARILHLMNGVKEILEEKHDNAHPAWTQLEEELGERATPDAWYEEEVLKRAILEANDEEFEAWSAFRASHACCTGSSPSYRHVAPVNALMKALLLFFGGPLDEWISLETLSSRDEGNEERERQKLDELKRAVQTRNPLNATTIIHYVELCQIARDLEHNRQSVLTVMEELYDTLVAMIKERVLGNRQVIYYGIERIYWA
ncbi:hypothetical protein MKX08_010112 [Trichoderma sp. CBMAI-0020]|nr:hypothetical protein MKX08_010112 [Trichoderma sp. CBMAI-0020]WOD46348.1 hypothetical protein [Trichoderma atroviride]